MMEGKENLAPKPMSSTDRISEQLSTINSKCKDIENFIIEFDTFLFGERPCEDCQPQVNSTGTGWESETMAQLSNILNTLDSSLNTIKHINKFHRY